MSETHADLMHHPAPQLRQILAHLPDVFNCVAWSPDGSLLASGASDGTIRVWEVDSGRLVHTLEGHQSEVWSVAWAPDGQRLASGGDDGTIRVWNGLSGEELRVYESAYPAYKVLLVSFQEAIPTVDMLGRTPLDEPDIIIRTLPWDTGIPGATSASMQYVSAKIVLVGESNVGKSCLALRLAQDRYEEQGTTHGMRLWSMLPEQLSADMAAPSGEQREVVLWDLGGQDEYRLVHQLFLHDTTLALILLDPTRDSAFDDVLEWNVRLEKQLRGQSAVKLLVGTKEDQIRSDLVDQERLKKLMADCGMVDFYSTSAKASTGIDALRQAIAQRIDWRILSHTTRPRLFQRIRETIAQRRNAGDVVLLYTDLVRYSRDAEPEDFHLDAVHTIVRQVAHQGVLVDTSLATGERALVLHIGYIETYAGALILAARHNQRSVPALEISEAIIRNSFPGIADADRLSPLQERAVLECVVQLLIEHGICLKHAGLLIFPTLFPATATPDDVGTAHTVSLYYDFSGAIDNIYSSLVVRLALSERFGRVRLWKEQAVFERAGHGVCSVRKVDRRGGLAHLDLLFSDQTAAATRDLFTTFVEEHVHSEGVTIKEVLEIVCGTCGFRFDETLVRDRIQDGRADVLCPRCEIRLPINAGAQKARESNPALGEALIALKSVIDQRKREDIREVKQVVTPETRLAGKTPMPPDPIRILHLSDLHLHAGDDHMVRLQPLLRDIQDQDGGLGFASVDYVVVSGDLTNRASSEEFEQVYQFLDSLIHRLHITAARCVIVPGNHDLSWDNEVYNWRRQRQVDVSKLKTGSYVRQGDGFLVRDEDEYPTRFTNFRNFYHSLTQEQYPHKAESQSLQFLFEEPRLQFLALNSAWEIDEYYPERSGIHPSALAAGLDKANTQIIDAKANGRLANDANVLRLAVWHHPITGNEKINNDAFLDQL